MKSRSVNATVDEASEDLRLDQFLARRFGQELDLSRRKFRDLIESGAVYVNGRRMTRLSQTVARGDRIELRLSAAGSERNEWALTPERILYEDDDLIAIDKPPGLPTQATLDTSRHNLHRAVETWLRSHRRDAYCGLHHRLDRDTSGVIVFTASRRANKGLAEQFAGHSAQKTYLALSRALNPASRDDRFEMINHLRKKEGRPARMVAASSGGDRAETRFSVLKRGTTNWLIQAEPRTGRMHQIRVHLAESGLPILGDPLYAPLAIAKAAPRLLLHAAALRIRHPVTGREMELKATLPDDFREALGPDPLEM